MSIASSRTPFSALGKESTTTEALRASVSDAEARVNEVTGAASQRARPLDLSGRVVLLAADGSEGSAAGAHIALALAARYHATIRVVSVVDTRTAPILPPLDMALAMTDDIVGAGVHEEQQREVRAALSAATARPIDWPVRIMLGTPANSIVREARRVGAILMIVGLRRHGRLERAMQDETSLNVMRNASCPVLGIIPGTTALPRRVLGAIDFSETSLIAARTAGAVVGEDAEFVLAYVAPLTGRLPDDGESVIHDLGVQAGFARTMRHLEEEGITLKHVVLHRRAAGTPADALLEYAEATASDLVAAGSARHGRVERWMLGSVSTDLVRDGRRSVLIVPPRDPVRR